LYGELQIFSRYIQLFDFRYLGVYGVCTVVKRIDERFYDFSILFGFFAPCFGDFQNFDAYRVCTAAGIDIKGDIFCCAKNAPFYISLKPRTDLGRDKNREATIRQIPVGDGAL
jgi:hypothetical protein